MEVIFTNLPDNMSAYEIRRLVSQAILPKGFIETTKSLVSMSTQIKRLEFKIITETKSGRECRFGIAIVEPEKAGRRIILRLHNKVFRGYHLSVREYNNRSYSNDRRDVNWRERQWVHSERREQERRVSAHSATVS